MKRTKVDSSNIHSVSHNRRKGTMRVTFRPKDGQPFKTANTYVYQPVTHEQAEALVNAESVGRHFVQHIRNNKDIQYKKVR